MPLWIWEWQRINGYIPRSLTANAPGKWWERKTIRLPIGARELFRGSMLNCGGVYSLRIQVYPTYPFRKVPNIDILKWKAIFYHFLNHHSLRIQVEERDCTNEDGIGTHPILLDWNGFGFLEIGLLGSEVFLNTKTPWNKWCLFFLSLKMSWLWVPMG